MPLVNAAGNRSLLMASHGGTPPYGPGHTANSGFLSASPASRCTRCFALAYESTAGGGFATAGWLLGCAGLAEVAGLAELPPQAARTTKASERRRIERGCSARPSAVQ